MRLRTASAASRSERLSANCRTVTSASRHGASAGCPSLGNRDAKAVSSYSVPNSSLILRYTLPRRNTACAMRAVSSGTDPIGSGRSDMAALSLCEVSRHPTPGRGLTGRGLRRLRQQCQHLDVTERFHAIKLVRGCARRDESAIQIHPGHGRSTTARPGLASIAARIEATGGGRGPLRVPAIAGRDPARHTVQHDADVELIPGLRRAYRGTREWRKCALLRSWTH